MIDTGFGTPNSAIFLLHETIALMLGIFTLTCQCMGSHLESGLHPPVSDQKLDGPGTRLPGTIFYTWDKLLNVEWFKLKTHNEKLREAMEVKISYQSCLTHHWSSIGCCYFVTCKYSIAGANYRVSFHTMYNFKGERASVYENTRKTLCIKWQKQ